MRFNRHFVSEPGEMQFAYDSETRVECVRMLSNFVLRLDFCLGNCAQYVSLGSCRLPTFAWDPPLWTFGSFSLAFDLWLRIFGMKCFGIGYLALDSWFWILPWALGSSARLGLLDLWLEELGNGVGSREE